MWFDMIAFVRRCFTNNQEQRKQHKQANKRKQQGNNNKVRTRSTTIQHIGNKTKE